MEELGWREGWEISSKIRIPKFLLMADVGIFNFL
jgi:hypothetical protein